jgi:NTP pyrophosphatase (non-canonical NTP hydrolase)
MNDQDRRTTIHELRQQADDFIKARNWGKQHTPKNLAVSIAIEAGELMEHYQWGEYTVKDQEKDEQIKAELADIIIYCLYFANASGIDVAEAVKNKLSYTAEKYPVETFNQESDDPKDYENIKKHYRHEQA